MITLPQAPGIVAIAGDWHGHLRWALDRINDAQTAGGTTIVHLGDFEYSVPDPATRKYLFLLGGSITLIGYPTMVHADKIITALQRGTINTRWRDFADVYVLAGRHPVDGDELHRALSEVAARRGLDLAPLAGTLTGYADLAQPRWAAWRRKQQLEQRLPAQFSDVIETVIAFADPALSDRAYKLHWRPDTAHWA